MIYCCINDSTSGPEKLSRRYYHSKEKNCGQKTLNLAFFSVKKGRTAVGIISVLIYIVIILLFLPLVLLSIIFIFTIK